MSNMKRIAFICLVLLCGNAIFSRGADGEGAFDGSEPRRALRHLIEADMEGDADARLDIAAKSAVVDMALCNQISQEGSIAYMLDYGGMQIAASWRFDDGDYPCSESECTLGVVFRVVGSSKGCNIPSWKSDDAWYVVPFTAARYNLIKYRLRKINGYWKIDQFPPPFVSPGAMKAFFDEQLLRRLSHQAPANADPRAKRNDRITIEWTRRQLDLLAKLPR